MSDSSEAIPGEYVVDSLVNSGFSTFTGVPCSYVSSVIEAAQNSDRCDYVIAANEGASLGIAAGRFLGGKLPVVLLQNSGVGNLLNPLTSLTLIYRLGGLMLVTLRAYPDGMRDEPQHRIIGRELTDLLTRFEVSWRLMPSSPAEIAEAADQAAHDARDGQMTAWLVPKNAIAPSRTTPNHPFRPMSRQQAIALIAEECREEDLVVGSTGMIGRELFASADRPGNFYMQGSMGHAINIGLGLCGTADRKVVILDGDGAVLMHMGSLSTIGYHRPRDLIHVVLDNEAYGTTGNQLTTSPTTDFVTIATACGYTSGVECSTPEALQLAFQDAQNRRGPHFIRVKVHRGEDGDTPRVTERYTPEENTQRVLRFATGNVADV